MAARGFFQGEVDDHWNAAVRERWELFLGSENYDNRINGGELLDLEVLADLRRKYGPGGSPGPVTREGRVTTGGPA